MSINKMFKNKKGISIIEVLVVVVIISVGLVALLNAVTSSLKISRLMKENDQAKELAQEALEAVRSFRDGTDWDTNGLGNLILYVPGNPYYPCVTNNILCKNPPDNPPQWILLSGEESIPGGVYKRKVVFKNVSRDSNSNIVSMGGTVDPNTKEITATVSLGTRKVEISTYLTNWR